MFGVNLNEYKKQYVSLSVFSYFRIILVSLSQDRCVVGYGGVICQSSASLVVRVGSVLS